MTDLTDETIENLVKIFIESGSFAVADLIVAKGYRFTPDELKIIIKKECGRYYTCARVLAQQKYFFTVDELITYGNPSDGGLNTIARHMVDNGYDEFTVDDIIALCGNMNNDRESVAILMAKYGHHFTLDEIIRLNNPVDSYRISLAHLMAHHCEFSATDIWELRNSVSHCDVSVGALWKLRNPADRDGDTIAHWMAKAGYRFSVEELKFLNNPKNKDGLSIAHVMAQAGHKFSKDESKELGLPLKLEQKSIFLDIKNGYRFDDCFYGGIFSELYVNGKLCMSVESGSCSNDIITIFNQEAYSKFESYACSIRHDFDEKTFLLYKGRLDCNNLLSDSQAATRMVYGQLITEKESRSHFPDIGHG